MGQTIICEYLAAWESTGTQPDPTAFGFDGLYSMLEECQGTMLKLGTAANDGKHTIDAKDEAIASLRGSLASTKLQLNAESMIAYEAGKRIAELEEKNVKLAKDLKAQLDAKDAMITVHLARIETVREVNMVLSDTIDSQRGRIAELEAQLADIETARFDELLYQQSLDSVR